jgi:TPR repeat protein
LHGDRDGANHLGFCLEHGSGVEQNIELAAEYSNFAADHNYAEVEQSHAHCLRLLGRWEVPDRSGVVAAHPREIDHFTALFADCLDDPELQDDD